MKKTGKRQLRGEALERRIEAVIRELAAEDWKDYLRGRQLNRTDIAKECGFATSVLRQNPTVKGDLEALEKELADSGIIPSPSGESSSQATSTPSDRATDDRIILINDKAQKRIKALEEKNAALSAELMELRAKLKRYEMIEKHLTETGRMVRP